MALLATTFALFAAFASPASAAQLWADPASSSGGSCTELTPCSLSNALNGAVDGDVVMVKGGSYAVGSLTISKGIEIRGASADDMPVLSGTTNVATISGDHSGLVLRNLKITGTGGDALTLKGGAHGDRLILRSETADGAKIVGAPGTTTLTNSLVTSGGGSSIAALKLRDAAGAGSVEVRNVTAYATNTDATGIRCETSTSTSAIVNSIARGNVADIDATTGGAQCSASYTNVRSGMTPGTLTTSNLVASDPALDGQYKPLAGSNTVDAGVDHASNGTLDLAGATRVRGTKTDIGAYELQADAPAPADTDGDAATGRDTDGGTTTTTTTTTAPPAADEPAGTSVLAPAAPPQLGKSVLLDQAGSGTVLVKLPGTNRFVPLADAANLPLGTTVDTRKGSVTLSSALPGGKAQTGTFGGGLFEVRQAKSGMTDIHLRGTFTKKCAKRKKTIARAAAKKRKARVRRLWAKDKGGRFRTHGTNSVATVRGTRWLTEDRCDGTLTKVTEGAVDVRDKRTGKVRRVRAGRSVLVRSR